MTVTAHLARTIQDQATGRLLLGAQVTLCNPGTQTPISGALFSDAALTLELPNPYICDDGIIDVYLGAPTNVLLKTQYGDAINLIDNVAVLPPADDLFVSPTPIVITNSPGTNYFLRGVDTASAQWVLLDDLYTPQSAGLLGWFLAQAVTSSSVVRDGNGVTVSANILWPDGASGVYTLLEASSMFPGKADSWSMSYTSASHNFVFTQPTITRDGNGDIIDQPVVTITGS